MVENRYKDLTGQTFGKLTVLSFHHRKIKTHGTSIYWLCRCECGKETIVDSSHLKSGHTKTCGCGNARYWKTALGLSTSKLYKIWHAIKYRCYNKNAFGYEYYGGRGIKVCDEWKNSSSSFLFWALNNGYKEGLTIDRIDTNGDYCPENCRWVDMKTQCRNTRRNKHITINGETRCLTDWCFVYNICLDTVLYHVRKKNKSVEEAFLFVATHKWNNSKKVWEQDDSKNLGKCNSFNT